METLRDKILRLKRQPRQGRGSLQDHLDDLNRQAQAGGSAFDVFTTAVNIFTKAITDTAEAMKKEANSLQGFNAGIQLAIGYHEKLASVTMAQIKNITFLDRRYAGLNKTFGIGRKAAGDFGYNLEKISDELKVGIATTEKYAQNINKLIPGFVAGSKSMSDFQKKLYEAQKIMTTQLGVTEAAAEGYERYAASVNKGSGKDQLEMQMRFTKALEEQTEMTGTMRDLTEELGNLTSDLQLQYSRIPGSLELGVLKARALGLTMAQLNSAGNSLLNIESSIGDELEYQLLTGERLLDKDKNSLTNAYREATLKGDANKQAEIMNEILESQGDNLQNNLYARQVMAKMLGIDETALAKAVQQKRIYDELAAKTNITKAKLMEMKPEDLMALAKDVNITAADYDALDTRTIEQKTYDEIKSLNSKIIGTQLDKKLATMPAGTTTGDLLIQTQTEASTMLERQRELAGSFAELDIASLEAAGNFHQISVSMSKLTSVALELAATIPGVGAVLQLISAAFPGMLDAAGKVLYPNALAPVGENLESPNAEPAQNISGADALITFNPDDKFMMVAGTNVNGNADMAAAVSNGSGMTDAQINSLATAFAAAVVNGMRGVTITTDPLYSATSINGSRYA